jgi:uncharacterized protein (TIGR03000 family)
MFRSRFWHSGAAALVTAGLLGAAAAPAAPPGAGHAGVPAGAAQFAPSYRPSATTTSHYYSPPSYPSYYQTPVQSYYRQHYYTGTYPNYNYYSYFDNLPPVYSTPTPGYGTVRDPGGAGGPSLGPLYPDEYGYESARQAPPNRRAVDLFGHIIVRVPADAVVRFDGYKTKSTGPVRQFDTPPLTPGKPYNYEIEAQWEENGRQVTQKQAIPVSAGRDTEIQFPPPPGDRGEGGKPKPK